MLDTSGSQVFAQMLWELLKLITLGFAVVVMLCLVIAAVERLLLRIARLVSLPQARPAADDGQGRPGD